MKNQLSSNGFNIFSSLTFFLSKMSNNYTEKILNNPIELKKLKNDLQLKADSRVPGPWRHCVSLCFLCLYPDAGKTVASDTTINIA